MQLTTAAADDYNHKPYKLDAYSCSNLALTATQIDTGLSLTMLKRHGIAKIPCFIIMHMHVHMCHDVCIGVQASVTLKVLMFCNKVLIAPLMSQGSVPVASFTSRGLTCISNRHSNVFHLSLLACCQSALASTK